MNYIAIGISVVALIAAIIAFASVIMMKTPLTMEQIKEKFYTAKYLKEHMDAFTRALRRLPTWPHVWSVTAKRDDQSAFAPGTEEECMQAIKKVMDDLRSRPAAPPAAPGSTEIIAPKFVLTDDVRELLVNTVKEHMASLSKASPTAGSVPDSDLETKVDEALTGLANITAELRKPVEAKLKKAEEAFDDERKLLEGPFALLQEAEARARATMELADGARKPNLSDAELETEADSHVVNVTDRRARIAAKADYMEKWLTDEESTEKAFKAADAAHKAALADLEAFNESNENSEAGKRVKAIKAQLRRLDGLTKPKRRRKPRQSNGPSSRRSIRRTDRPPASRASSTAERAFVAPTAAAPTKVEGALPSPPPLPSKADGVTRMAVTAPGVTKPGVTKEMRRDGSALTLLAESSDGSEQSLESTWAGGIGLDPDAPPARESDKWALGRLTGKKKEDSAETPPVDSSARVTELELQADELVDVQD